MGEGEKGIKRNTKIKKVHHSCINQKQNKERKSTSTGRHKKKKREKKEGSSCLLSKWRNNKRIRKTIPVNHA